MIYAGWLDLDDPVVMAKARDDPHDAREGMRAADSMHETGTDDEAFTQVRPTSESRRFRHRRRSTP
jgi:hypothetical protein